MNYPCKLIQDLLPLYHDGVCSGESRAAVEEHLAGCAECSRALENIRGAEGVSAAAEYDRETQKADSLKRVKRKILKKQVLIAVGVLAAAVVVWFGASIPLKLSERAVKAENISVTVTGGNAVARLYGSFPSGMRIKNVEVAPDKYYMFFGIEESLWDRLTTPNSRYTDMVLAYGEKGAADIERVYCYGGDLTGLETLSEEELNGVIEQSVLMWSR
ncbi:MAG: zf-HC2 domain-containing protein [Lachnospiraceae bacterium]|nr:zf-HC2 domain-containing protein [Ruminococcus sp.]MCM1274459.1 zf-HC2 domain-containing protein [Lachnospiraceae bacterium]